ncbi:MAG: aromatic ring-opening dioxygenase LigA [Planctomyces sp.]|nr:aromatic ring-opening dioxygenase LigA [Planctomyces sp.]
MRTIKRHLWIGALALGLLFIGMGALFMVTALEAKGMIRAALAEENVTTSKDAVKFGVEAGVLVTNAATAEAQSEVIKMHSIDRYGLYTEMERDDPNRATYIKGLTLRNSLNMAVMGFGVADLAMGMGAIIILMGAGTMAFLAPVVYLATNEEDELPEVNAGARAAPPAPAV